MLDHLVEEVRAFSDKDAVQDDFTIAILKVGA
jgi:serine phosphatase RsbU (regulator of sigma subunit)